MRRLVLCLLALAGCTNDPVSPHRATAPRVEHIPPDSVDGRFAGIALDSLPSELGAPWRWSAFVSEFSDGTAFVFLPLDAEDEHRYLVRISKNGESGPILAIGFMEPTWFSQARAETLAAYEGWVFLYDLEEGLRRISVLFEGGTVLDRSVDYPYHARPPDVLSDNEAFTCLAQEMLRRPDVPSRIHRYPDEVRVRLHLAQYVHSLFRCSSTPPAFP